MKTLDLKENTGIKNIKEFYKTLSTMIESEEELVLDFSSVQTLDLSVLQLLIASLKDVRTRGTILKLRSVPENVRRQLQACNLLRSN